MTLPGVATRLALSVVDAVLCAIMARNGPWRQIGLLLALGLCLPGIAGSPPLRAAQLPAKPAENAPAAHPSPDAEEQKVLDDAFRSAENNPQIIIQNLEGFLARFPKSSRREIVLRTICNYALEANAPAVAVRYGQMLLELTPNDPKLLALLIDALARQNDQASHSLAIDYSSRLIKFAETQREHVASEGENNDHQWPERIASLYAQRARFYRESGDPDKAFADNQKSYATYPTAVVAESLGDAENEKGDSAQAVDYYLTAFVFPDRNPDIARRNEVRRKLGSAYLARHHAEKGLGELALARYDAMMQELGGRFSSGEPQNAGRHDPFEFVLQRLDGSPMRLADYRGKVIVVDFWATWCGPCRLQGKLVDRVAASFRKNSDTAFLSLSIDADRSGVSTFLKQEGWTLSAAYAQGLDLLLNVRQIPTVVIFDRQGRVAYREEGVIPQTFAQELEKHVRQTLQASEGGEH